MNKKVIIIGASGHGKVIADIIKKNGDIVAGFLDDNKVGSFNNNMILGTIGDIDKFQSGNTFVIGIGDNYIREKIDVDYKANWYTAIHPTAIISNDVVIGEGTVVMAGAVINTSSQIGRHCIINSGAIVEHDNRLDDYVHISPNATLCGTVNIGKNTHVGAGAIIRNNVDICSDVILGTGTVVVNNIVDEGTYVGVPAKKKQI